MTRKIIIGVIGATNGAPEGVPELAEAIGHEIGKRNAILMTGGSPAAKDYTVKDRAIRGCNSAGGRMISILKKSGQPAGPVCVSGERRVELHTDLSALGRDPITGGMPDLLIALEGGGGTLVELAFAFRKPVPTFFVQSARDLEKKFGELEEKLKKLRDLGKQDLKRLQKYDIEAQIKIALEEYRIGCQADIEARAKKLKKHLIARLAQAQDVKTDGTHIARDVVDTALLGYMPNTEIETETSFEGLPPAQPKAAEEGSPKQAKGERRFKQSFEEAVEKLSAFNAPFP